MKNRNPLFVFLASLLTLNIYYLFWLYSTSKELKTRNIKLPPFILIAIPLFELIIGTLGLVYLTISGWSVSDAGIVIVVFSLYVSGAYAILLIVFGLYWVFKYCRALEIITNRNLTTKRSFATFIILNVLGIMLFSGFGAIWPAIVQHYLNKLGSADTGAVTDSGR